MIFLSLASSATDAAVFDAVFMYDSASGQATVISQATDFPPIHGINERPSGRFPSDLARPVGSLTAGMPADAKALQMISFNAQCRVVLLGAFLQTKAWRPSASTSAPHGQLCGMHNFKPRRRPTATRTASSLSLRPQLATGNADIQSPECGAVAARKHARDRLLLSES